VTLLAWSQELPDWQRDALHRIALCEALNDADRAAIRARLQHAHGLPVEVETTCTPLSEADLPAAADGDEPTILCSIGPVRHIDKLAEDQELRFGRRGLTNNFGDNATGKSGYARVAKKLCAARLVDDLQGDVFAAQTAPRAQVCIRYLPPGAQDPVTEVWTDATT
jgi:hypothetical protein